MRSWELSVLFYAGIVVPTGLTLALFVLFVFCWRRQSARSAVLTKRYDPHGATRTRGIPARHPPPPVFPRPSLPLPCPAQEEDGGEVNAAYDLGEVRASDHIGVLHLGSWHALRGHEVLVHPQPRQLGPACCGEGVGEMDRAGEEEDNFHHRLDSGLSEARESPSGGEGEGEGKVRGSGGEGGEGGGDRPHSQNSHSSHSCHSTDSEDSGFRSSRSGPLLAASGPPPLAEDSSTLQETDTHTKAKVAATATADSPTLVKSKSAATATHHSVTKSCCPESATRHSSAHSNSMVTATQHSSSAVAQPSAIVPDSLAASAPSSGPPLRGEEAESGGEHCCADSESDPPIHLTPAALWAHYHPHPYTTHPHYPHYSPYHYPYPPEHPHHHPSPHYLTTHPTLHHHDSGHVDRSVTSSELNDASAHMTWRYLQPSKVAVTSDPRLSDTCQRLTLTQGHSDSVNPEGLSFSVV